MRSAPWPLSFQNSKLHSKHGGNGVTSKIAVVRCARACRTLTLEKPKTWSPNWLDGTHIYIYIYAVGSITWPHFGHFNVNNLATSRSISWPPFLSLYKKGFLLTFFCAQFSGGWCKISVFDKKLVNKGGSEKNIVHFFGGGRGGF